MPSCPQHPRILDQPCTCPPNPPIRPKTTATIITASVATIFIIASITLMRGLIHESSPPALIAFLVIVILGLVGAEMGMLRWAWKEFLKPDLDLETEDVEGGEGRVGDYDCPPDYHRMDTGLLAKNRRWEALRS
ncbi:MAG: hypothetical protein L6R42_008623 [Xanthoria sp. 1 TBL-2021]|nr:MAG: hypothetical protein L6R42_008623 [Xanthoria sp. 1 TBL-2021]